MKGKQNNNPPLGMNPNMQNQNMQNNNPMGQLGAALGQTLKPNQFHDQNAMECLRHNN